MTYQVSETTTRKSYDGKWQAESEIVLQKNVKGGALDDKQGDRILKFSTSKDSRGNISTFASVCIRCDESGYSTETHKVFEDFTQRYNVTTAARVLEKTVRDAHAVTMRHAQNIAEQAIKQYLPQEAAQAA